MTITTSTRVALATAATVIASQAVGAILLTLLALLFAEQMPPLENLLWSGVGGLAGALGLMSLVISLFLAYRVVATLI